MILHTNETPIHSSGNIQQKEFRIPASGKAFKILSANLYQNKIRAFVRELSANAYDAHIAAGHPEKPFDVHLPSSIDPMFWIRDYGIGLSEESVMNLYTTYFESTKAESNDYVGALGLGSKSPFAYVDSFNVTSYFNGTITMYDMSIRDGVPNVAVLYQAETTEPNGMKITLPIKADDYQRVIGEATFVYGTFKTKPNFVGRTIECDLTSVVHGKGYFTTNDRARYAGAWALMGNIAYPINRHEIKLGTVFENIAESRSVFLTFELGDLDITPSREELSYDPETIKFLQDRVDSIGNVVIEDILKTYEGATCPRDTINLINKQEPFGLRTLVKKRVVIDGKDLLAWGNWFTWDNVHPSLGRSKYRLVDVSLTGEVSAKWEGQRSWNSNNRAGLDRNAPYIIDHDEGNDYLNTVRALVDAGKIPKGRTVLAFRSADPANKYVMDALIEKWMGKAHVFKVSDCVALKKAYLKADKANKPAAPSRGRPVTSEKFILSTDGLSVYRRECNYYAADVDSYDGYYAMKFFDAYVDSRELPVVSRKLIEEFMLTNKIKEIMIVRKSHWKRIEANPNAKHVFEGIKEQILASSPAQVARKFGLNVSGAPAWIRHTVDVCPEFTGSFIRKVKYKTQHKLTRLYRECVASVDFNRECGTDVKKKIDLYSGRAKAVNTSVSSHYATLTVRYPMLAKAMENLYTRDARAVMRSEIQKILG